VEAGSRPGGAITLLLDSGDPEIGDEGYTLTVTAQGVTVRARAAAGLFHGAQSLRQLLPAAIETDGAAGRCTVPGGTVVDRPRFPWRGAMLDVCRHFFGVADVKRYIDQIALYKMNILHLHLSDDQGWRIEISKWPRLTEIGGSTAVGGGPGGWYSHDDYREIVAHARSRHVTVVPDIDTPGHTNAALASYAALNCDGLARSLYTGTEMGFSSLCAGKVITAQFLHDVYSELAAVTPGPYIFIGGDEATEVLSASDYASLVGVAAQSVVAAGKIPVGWADIGAVALPAGTIAAYWNHADNGTSAVRSAAGGLRLVLAPADHAFLDQKYDASTPLGLDWAGPVSVEQAYDWEPGDYGIPEEHLEGVEATLFSETLSTMADIEYMAFPRLPGIAEIGWSPQATHDWSAYRERLAAQGPRWQAMGINYDPAPDVPWPA
jgi:hexosaminidase